MDLVLTKWRILNVTASLFIGVLDYANMLKMETPVWNQSSVTNVSATTASTTPLQGATCGRYFMSSIIIASMLEAVSLYVLIAHAIFSCTARYQRNVSKVNRLCLISTLLAFLFCTTTLLSLLPQFPNYIMIWILAAFYWTGISVTYTILWARQRRFYSD